MSYEVRPRLSLILTPACFGSDARALHDALDACRAERGMTWVKSARRPVTSTVQRCDACAAVVA
jgi:hypothetical protein